MTAVREAATKIAGRDVGPVGYGMLGLSIPWAPVEFNAAVPIMKAALESGSNFWNGGSHYGTPERNSLHLLKHYFEKYPEDVGRVVLSIKGAYGFSVGPMGSRESLRESVESAVAVLGGIKTIDIFEMARVDPETPIEVSIKALGELFKEGKIGGIGLSEVGAATIRRANEVHPIAAVEIELSLFTPDPVKNGILDTCHELNIPVVAYSPISRGWLTGRYRTLDDIPGDDYRRRLPRFGPDAFEQNFKLVEAVEDLAKRKGLTTAQVALSWVVQQGAIPIPGSTKIERAVANSQIVTLADAEMLELQRIIDTLPVVGERYGGAHERLLNM